MNKRQNGVDNNLNRTQTLMPKMSDSFLTHGADPDGNALSDYAFDKYSDNGSKKSGSNPSRSRD